MSLLRNADNNRLIAAKSAVARALCSRPVAAAITGATRGVIPSRGLRIDTRSLAVDDQARAQLFWGLYEGAEIRMVRQHLAKAQRRDSARAKTHTIVDLGTSLGVLAAATAAHILPLGGRVIGVEANSALIPLADLNIRLNARGRAVHITHGAIDYTREPGEPATFNATGNHVSARLDAEASGETFTAPVIYLSDLLREQNVDRYALLMDIEGAEAGLLLHDAGALKSCEHMVVEFHDTNYEGRAFSRHDLLELATAQGFAERASYGSVYVLTRY